MAGIFNNLSQYNQYRDAMTGGAIPLARHGKVWHTEQAKQKSSSRSWELVKEFKGKSHAEGGINIEVGDGYVKMLSGRDGEADEIAKKGRFWRALGAGAYGVGEGLLDTISLGLTDRLTDKGYEALQKVGGSESNEIGTQNAIRGYGTAAGATLGAITTGGATTGSAISQGAKGLGMGISNTAPNSEFAQLLGGTFLPLAGTIAGLAVGDLGYQNKSNLLQLNKFAAESTGKTAEAANLAKKIEMYNKLNKVTSAAGKVSKFMPLVQIGASLSGLGMKKEQPNYLTSSFDGMPQNDYLQVNGTDYKSPSYNRYNSTQRSIDMLRTMQGGGLGSVNINPLPQNLAVAQGGYISPTNLEPTDINQVPSVTNNKSKYQFVNDLKRYGINT